MPNHNRGPKLVGIAETDLRTGARHDPAVELMMHHVLAGDVTVGEMSQETLRLRRSGVTMTAELMGEAITRVMGRRPTCPQLPVERPPSDGGRWRVHRNSGEVVYYMRVGNRVKIGTTVNLELRLKVVSPEELLATEPGGYSLERQRHREFKDLRTRGEWFKLEGSLADHVAKLQTEPKAD